MQEVVRRLKEVLQERLTANNARDTQKKIGPIVTDLIPIAVLAGSLEGGSSDGRVLDFAVADTERFTFDALPGLVRVIAADLASLVNWHRGSDQDSVNLYGFDAVVDLPMENAASVRLRIVTSNGRGPNYNEILETGKPIYFFRIERIDT